MNLLEGQIDLMCTELKLPGLKKSYRSMAREAADHGHLPMQFLSVCLIQELASRRESRLKS